MCIKSHHGIRSSVDSKNYSEVWNEMQLCKLLHLALAHSHPPAVQMMRLRAKPT
jgi:hypothetical protein